MSDFQRQASQLREEMIARRRELHQHPELGFEEGYTAGVVAESLQKLGLEVQTGVGKTGVVGLLEGDQAGPTVMLRADMDALPIQEENDVPYASQIVGKMHACGHDGHTTILLAVAKMLAQYRSQMRGRVKFVFQPAEELGLGAAAMIEDGVLENPVPDVCLGLHLWNEAAVGEVLVTGGAIMAGADSFHVEIRGQGGHAALPDRTHDPIIAMVNTISALQTIVSRNVPPLDTAVISVTQVQAGTAVNIIPEQAAFHGTIRTYHSQVRDLILNRMSTIIRQSAEMMGCQASVSYEQLSLPVINAEDLAADLLRFFQRTAPQLRYVDNYRVMGAEDFAFFLDRIPGVFFFVGSANAERKLHYPHHHPRFDFDEDALVIGASLLASAAAHQVLPNIVG